MREYPENQREKSFTETYQDLVNTYPGLQILFWIGAAALIYAGINDAKFYLRYTNPEVSRITKEKINISKNPTQTSTSEKPFKMISNDGGEFRVEPKVNYEISGLVVAKNTNLWLRGIMNSDFDRLVLIDLGLAWGDAADPNYKKFSSYSSQKTLGQARALYTKVEANSPYPSAYIFAHSSHTHIIPANDNVMSALMTLGEKDKVKIEGYLVDIFYEGNYLAKTSLSRTDSNARSRGSGACEVMYAKKVQIGNKLYY